jgi:DNA modification methylase
LLLPPPEYAPRRILIPFAGVMSEVIGAMQAGWEDITAIEFEPEYVEIGRARIRYWEAKKEDKQNRLF